MLGLWLLQQLFYALLVSEGSGAAWAAHAGGFLAGAAAALVLKHFRVEGQVINPAIEREISVQQPPALEEGMASPARGELEAARQALSTALAEDPPNPDTHLAIWQSFVNEKRGAEGARHLQAVIDHELLAASISWPWNIGGSCVATPVPEARRRPAGALRPGWRPPTPKPGSRSCVP